MLASTFSRSIMGSGSRIEIVRVEGLGFGRLTFSASLQSMYLEESFAAQNTRSLSSDEKLGIGRRVAGLGTAMLLPLFPIGTPKAITATAHKIARLVCRLLRFGLDYIQLGEEKYERRHRARTLRHIERRAFSLGFVLRPASTSPTPSPATA
jgi:hypothetical protein